MAMEIKRTIPQIFAAGYVPYYDNEELYIFQNPNTSGLQFYKASFEKVDGQWQPLMTKLDDLTDLLLVRHLMPPDMQKNLMIAAQRQGIVTEVQSI